jgi:hypothetical protein
MAETATIASLATAGGTLVLAVATYSATRSANRATRISEHALEVGLRPVLLGARQQDPPQKVGYGDDHWVVLRDGLGAAQESDGNLYFAIPLRNVASGLAVLRGWNARPGRLTSDVGPLPAGEFRAQLRDLYVPAGDYGFWQAAIRDPADPIYGPLREAIVARSPISVELLYGDHEGGQRTISRFVLTPRADGSADEPWLWLSQVGLHWNLDRADPR